MHRDLENPFQTECVYLSEGHDVSVDVRPGHRLRMLVVVSDHYQDGRVVLPYAVDHISKFIIT